METVDPACFGVLLVETMGDRARERRIHERLLAAGLDFQRKLALKGSAVYIRPKRQRWRVQKKPARCGRT